MTTTLEQLEQVAGVSAVQSLRHLSAEFKGSRVVHVNSTRKGGGVAEILEWMIPLMQELGIDASWEVIEGHEAFYSVTKAMHNGLQGDGLEFGLHMAGVHRETNRKEAERLGPILNEADYVFIHDPQPAGLREFVGATRAHWIWRCHIDVSVPNRGVWRYLKPLIESYEASIYSLAAFANPLPHPQFIITPSIDPLSEKNRELLDSEIADVRQRFGLDPGLPLLVQVSRFDSFKDPIGVIRAYRLVRQHTPVQLVLVGGSADDDPEGARVLESVQIEAGDDSDIHVLILPPDAHRTINAIQRAADIIIQKSLKEGFGLTVTEGMWKGKPVIGGNTGGIRKQVYDHRTGFLVNSPEGAAQRILYLLAHPGHASQMGKWAKDFVRENFLLTRHLREYLTLMLGLKLGISDRIELGKASAHE